MTKAKTKVVELGDSVKDLITGFKGIAVARTDWLYGCIRFGVQGKMDKDGKIEDAQWVDEPQLVVVTKAVVKEVKEASPDYGPRATPQLKSDSVRQANG